MQQFILIFDRQSGDLDVEKFGADATSAVRRYEALERLHRGSQELEIVLLGSKSLDDIRITHPHYFNKERGTDSLTQLEERVRDERSAS